MKNFDKVTLMNIRKELNAVLAKYGDEAGLEFDVGSIKFSDESFDAKIVVQNQGWTIAARQSFASNDATA